MITYVVTVVVVHVMCHHYSVNHAESFFPTVGTHLQDNDVQSYSLTAGCQDENQEYYLCIFTAKGTQV